MDKKGILNCGGMGEAAFALMNCIGCNKSDRASVTDTTGPARMAFMLNFLVSNAVLLCNGGSPATNAAIVASAKAWNCPNHGATFPESTGLTNGPATPSLTVYNTQFTTTSLSVYF